MRRHYVSVPVSGSVLCTVSGMIQILHETYIQSPEVDVVSIRSMILP